MKTGSILTLAAICLFALSNVSFGQAPNLGTASGFALFTANGAVTNSGASVVTGDIGTNVGAFSGFPIPGTIIGNTRLPGTPEAAQAALDVVTAYNSLNSTPCGSTTIIAELASLTLTPGVSCQPSATATSLNGTLTLSGAGVYIIKLNSALTTATNSTILLTNGATANNVFFQVNGAATLGTGSTFKGTILAMGAIVLNTLATLEGRGLSTVGAITLNNNIVTAVINAALPDFTPTILIDNLNFAPLSVGLTRDFIVTVTEINNAAPSGTISFKIAKLTAFTISYPLSTGLSQVLGGLPNTNGIWTFSEDDNYITVQTNAVFPAFGARIIGFSITRKPAIPASTIQSINITIVPNAGGEQNFPNNIAVTTLVAN